MQSGVRRLLPRRLADDGAAVCVRLSGDRRISLRGRRPADTGTVEADGA